MGADERRKGAQMGADDVGAVPRACPPDGRRLTVLGQGAERNRCIELDLDMDD